MESIFFSRYRPDGLLSIYIFPWTTFETTFTILIYTMGFETGFAWCKSIMDIHIWNNLHKNKAQSNF